MWGEQTDVRPSPAHTVWAKRKLFCFPPLSLWRASLFAFFFYAPFKRGDCAPLGDTPPPYPLLFAGAGVLDLSSSAWVILSQGYLVSEF